MSAFGREPVRGPVERAEKGARRDGRVADAELAASDAAGHQRADAALVPVALGDNRFPERRRQGIHLQVRRRALDLVDEAADVRPRQRAQPGGQRTARAPRGAERLEQAVERPILTEEEELVLALEIVIEVRGRQVGGDRDVAHAGRAVAARAEHARGGAQDRDAAGVRPDRTTVRNSNHGSILPRRPPAM